MKNGLIAIARRVGRRGRLSTALAAVCLAASLGAHADPALYAVGRAPAWVEPLVPESAAKAPAEQVSEGIQYLLIDDQVRVDAEEKTRFRHVASKVLNEHGLESAANIEIPFDPSYQKLTLHGIDIRRGGRLIAKLPTAQVKVLQRESGLESLIFDGLRTAHVFLEDVRVGDVVEYAYSVRGTNPVFANRHFGRFDQEYGVPVAHVHSTLWWPEGRPVHWTRHNDARPAAERNQDSHRVYTWDLRDVPAKAVESDAPEWFDPMASVEWSDYADWRVVRDWALPLYALPQAPAPTVKAVVDQLAAEHPEPESRLLAALTFVQSQVRYLGIEVGPGSHAPNPPERVLERRYGDCKDKTLLTVALLRGLGIEAAPALVHTTWRRAIEARQASPGVFNHVIVRARLAGHDYWLDPTRPPQKGTLDKLTQADFGRALVIDARSDGLVAMAGDQARSVRREIHASLDASAGVGKPARYVVTTTAHGASADSMRAALEDSSRERLQKQYLNYYTAHFGEMESTAPYTVFDDADANVISLKERYLLKAFWQHSEEQNRQEGSIEVPDVREFLRQPRSLVRSAPLVLNYPVDLQQVTEVKLPKGWTIKPETLVVQDEAFRFERQEHWDRATATLTLSDHYQALADHVDPARMAAYAAHLEKAREATSYTVYQKDQPAGGTDEADAAPAGGPHWLPAVAATLAVVMGFSLARRVIRWDPEPKRRAGSGLEEGPVADGPSGIGGWLLLPAIGLPVMMVRYAMALHSSWPSFSVGVWSALTQAGAPHYHALWMPVLLLELVAHIMLMFFAAATTWLFFRRRSSLPEVYIVYLVVAAAYVLADQLLALAIPAAAAKLSAGDWADLLRALVVTAIWLAYFMRSERVRRTFVRRAAPGDTPAVQITDPLPGQA